MSAQTGFSFADRTGAQRLFRGLFPVLLIPQYTRPVPKILKKDGQQ
jgi:hypothetical protein